MPIQCLHEPHARLELPGSDQVVLHRLESALPCLGFCCSKYVPSLPPSSIRGNQMQGLASCQCLQQVMPSLTSPWHGAGQYGVPCTAQMQPCNSRLLLPSINRVSAASKVSTNRIPCSAGDQEAESWSHPVCNSFSTTSYVVTRQEGGVQQEHEQVSLLMPLQKLTVHVVGRCMQLTPMCTQQSRLVVCKGCLLSECLQWGSLQADGVEERKSLRVSSREGFILP